MVAHPAKFSDKVLEEIARHCDPSWAALDPMAGAGRCHELQDSGAVRLVIGVEIEREWADLNDQTICYNSLYIDELFLPSSFDAIVVSPSYGNRLADHHNAQERCRLCSGEGIVEGHDGKWVPCGKCEGKGHREYKRITYRHFLGRELSPDNSGAMQWGVAYRDFHQRVWAKVVPLIKPGGVFILNCLAGETRVLTDQGCFPIQSLVGRTVNVMTVGGRWIAAPIQSFGPQRLHRIILKRNRRTREVYATAEHRWFTHNHLSKREPSGTPKRKKEVTTVDLQQGDHLVSVWPRMRVEETALSAVGVMHGVVWGDGSLTGDGSGGHRGSYVELFGEKKELLPWFPQAKVTEYRGARVTDLPTFFKAGMPALDESYPYLLGFLAGWFATDGHADKKGTCVIDCVNREHLEVARVMCDRLGIVTYQLYEIPHPTGTSFSSEPYTSWRLPLDGRTLNATFFLRGSHLKNWHISGAGQKSKERQDWIVQSVELTDRVEEVFCAVVPETESFALEDHLLTGNCKDHIRKHEVQKVTEWHVNTLKDLGLTLDPTEMYNVDTPGMRFGANREVRVVEGEWVIVLRKPA